MDYELSHYRLQPPAERMLAAAQQADKTSRVYRKYIAIIFVARAGIRFLNVRTLRHEPAPQDFPQLVKFFGTEVTDSTRLGAQILTRLLVHEVLVALSCWFIHVIDNGAHDRFDVGKLFSDSELTERIGRRR